MGLLSCFLHQNVQLLRRQLQQVQIPVGFVSCSTLPHDPSLPTSSPLEGSPSGKLPPTFRKNLSSWKSFESEPLFALLGLQFQWSFRHASFLSGGLEYSGSLKDKKLYPLLHKASQFNEMMSINCLSKSFWVLAPINNVKPGTDVSAVGCFLMLLVFSRKGIQTSGSMEARNLMRKFPILLVAYVYHFS